MKRHVVDPLYLDDLLRFLARLFGIFTVAFVVSVADRRIGHLVLHVDGRDGRLIATSHRRRYLLNLLLARLARDSFLPPLVSLVCQAIAALLQSVWRLRRHGCLLFELPLARLHALRRLHLLSVIQIDLVWRKAVYEVQAGGRR